MKLFSYIVLSITLLSAGQVYAARYQCHLELVATDSNGTPLNVGETDVLLGVSRYTNQCNNFAQNVLTEQTIVGLRDEFCETYSATATTSFIYNARAEAPWNYRYLVEGVEVICPGNECSEGDTRIEMCPFLAISYTCENGFWVTSSPITECSEDDR